MVLTRGQLCGIYAAFLSSQEKGKWAESAGYTSYHGLYRYLHINPDNAADSKIEKALEETVGETKFQQLVKLIQFQTNLAQNQSNVQLNALEELFEIDVNQLVQVKKSIIAKVFALEKSEDKERLEQLKSLFEDAVTACNAQLTKISLI